MYVKTNAHANASSTSLCQCAVCLMRMMIIQSDAPTRTCTTNNNFRHRRVVVLFAHSATGRWATVDGCPINCIIHMCTAFRILQNTAVVTYTRHFKILRNRGPLSLLVLLSSLNPPPSQCAQIWFKMHNFELDVWNLHK